VKPLRYSDEVRIMFVETDTEIFAVKLGPRADVYD
jgi:hypothetical protein